MHSYSWPVVNNSEYLSSIIRDIVMCCDNYCTIIISQLSLQPQSTMELSLSVPDQLSLTSSYQMDSALQNTLKRVSREIQVRRSCPKDNKQPLPPVRMRDIFNLQLEFCGLQCLVNIGHTSLSIVIDTSH